MAAAGNAKQQLIVQGATGGELVKQTAHAARVLYQGSKVVFKGTLEEARGFLKVNGPWKHKSGAWTAPQQGPVKYRCPYNQCPAECRAILHDGAWEIQAPTGFEHVNHGEGGVKLRSDSIFTEEMCDELELLFDVGSSPTEVYNTLIRSTHPRVKALVPPDLTVDMLRKWKKNSGRVCHKIATLNELDSWMADR